ncbi:MAG: hypothetical protein SF066_14495 [Thermoanaerobaculia bacterium]|nr:hypothetical protein [Thermoanaerobaculia bacterium]
MFWSPGPLGRTRGSPWHSRFWGVAVPAGVAYGAFQGGHVVGSVSDSWVEGAAVEEPSGTRHG